MALICSTCDKPTPMEKRSRKFFTHYIDDSLKIHKLTFSVCEMCQTLMRICPTDRVNREFFVVGKHLAKRALEGN